MISVSLPWMDEEGVGWSALVKKQGGKNPHAVALGRLGGLVRSEAKKRANKQNGRKGGLVKSRKKTLAVRSNDRPPLAVGLAEQNRVAGQRAGEQLSFLCACGKKSIELKTLGCCRTCYDRRHHSLRFFGGMRERVLERDRLRCRACC